ncbi:MAG: hypothetical protein WAV22_00630 [Porticoccaceae bacterium]
MDFVNLYQRQLAARWQLSEATLERWRSEGLGPKFLKLCGRVIYRQIDIEAYEESCLATFMGSCPAVSTKGASRAFTIEFAG